MGLVPGCPAFLHLCQFAFEQRLKLLLAHAAAAEVLVDGSKIKRCIYTPHSLRATTATLLLDAGVDIIKVKELLGHRHVTTTQIYDKRRRSLKEGALHDVPI